MNEVMRLVATEGRYLMPLRLFSCINEVKMMFYSKLFLPYSKNKTTLIGQFKTLFTPYFQDKTTFFKTLFSPHFQNKTTSVAQRYSPPISNLITLFSKT